ncbi:MAG: proteasome assembly chaperone family protein [Methanomassiliicoccales archaeon]|nr:MAG: proteasome assembly chaperone family protein [Methanomassiliicoccales archaeon]
MTEIHFHEYKKKDVENAMVVISFPTVGLISTIVANYIVSNLKLERIGALISDDFYPAAVVQDGVPTPPVRIFAGDNVCGPANSCDQLVVIASELPLKTTSFAPLANTIIKWCREHKCKVVVTIEGTNSPGPIDDEVKVYHVGSNEEAIKQMEGMASEPLESGMVSGLSGLLLYKGNLEDFSVLCLLSEAHVEFPDSRSAATVLGVIDKMIPQIKMDPEPLLKEAEIIEEQVKKAMSQIKPMSPEELPDTPPGMYG